MDYKTKDPEKNDGFRLALICIDIFSRYVYAEPLKTKEPAEVAAAFLKIAGHVNEIGNVTTDSGVEVKGVFRRRSRSNESPRNFAEAQHILAVS